VAKVGFGARFVPANAGDFDIFGGSGNNVDGSAGNTRYLPISGVVSFGKGVAEASSTQIVAAPFTIFSASFVRPSAPGSGKVVTYTLRKNGADTGLTCSLSGSGSGPGVTTNTCTGSVSVSAGDLLDWAVSLSSGGNSSKVAIGIAATPTYSCGFGSPIGGGLCRGYLTSGTTWSVPSDWNNSNNSIEAIGGGGAGGQDGARGGGGGGGAYSKASNVALTPSASVGISVGASGTSGNDGGDTYLCNSTSNCGSLAGSAVVVGAEGGKHGHYSGDGTGLQIGGAGGSSSNGVGSVTYSGGSGGSYINTGSATGTGGGGGSAGPSGNGKNGGDGSGSNAGGSGGGANNGSAGTTGSLNTGAVGGAGVLGTGGGLGGGLDSNAGNGAPGSGAGGGSGGARSNGGNGAIDMAFDATHGAGGGGGGAGGASSSGSGTENGGAGGTYGGGGGGPASESGAGTGNAGVGGQGLLVITYSVAPQVTTDIATAVGASSAVLNATLDADKGLGASQYGFAYSTDSSLSSGVSTSTLGTLSGPTYFNTVINSLSLNTTYYFRAYATNSIGTGYGAIQSFTTGNTTSTSLIRLFGGFKIKFLGGRMILY
jgi:hypothetical protein